MRTTRGDIETEVVVICCGVWSPRIARMAGASIPLTPAVHQMIDIGPVPRFAGAKSAIEHPIVRDMDTNMYERQDGSGLEVGSYAHRPILYDPEDIPSVEEAALSPTEFPFTQDDFALQMEQALELMPEIVGDESVGIKYAINGLLSLTPDGLPVLGETPETKGLWSAAAVWVKEGPGVGRALAEWMVEGEPEIDLQASDVARFHEHQKSVAHVKARAPRALQQDLRDRPPGRAVGVEPRRAAVALLRARARPRRRVLRDRRLGAPALVRVERRARRGVRRGGTRGRVGLALVVADHQRRAPGDARPRGDVRPHGLLRVRRGRARARSSRVQRVAMRQMDVKVGRVVYTPVLTPRGGFRSDLTIMRLADEHFRVVTGGAHGMADLKWFSDHLPADGPRRCSTSPRAGARSGSGGRARATSWRAPRATTSRTRASRSPRCRTIEVGSLRVMASRISYVGDLGWELYVPIEQGAKLWDIVWEAGEPHGVLPSGIGVYGTTGRLEKCYRAFGFELDGEYDVVEAGMAWGKVKDQDFVGKEAHVRHREQDPAAIMCTLTVDDHTSSSGQKRYMLGSEPILTRDGDPLTDSKGRRSFVTSAGAGPSVGKHLLMSYLPPEHARGRATSSRSSTWASATR